MIVETFFDPLEMSSSVPYHNVVDDEDKWVASLGKKHLDRYRTNLAKLAQPYAYYGDGETVSATYPPKDFIGAAAGLLSTVRDVAKYDIAIDRHVFLKKKTQEKPGRLSSRTVASGSLTVWAGSSRITTGSS